MATVDTSKSMSEDQEKTTFTCPFGTYAYRRMPFGLCNAPGTFQRCMMSIFSDLLEDCIEIFLDDFTVYGDSFETCLRHLDVVLERCRKKNLVLNYEKCHLSSIIQGENKEVVLDTFPEEHLYYLGESSSPIRWVAVLALTVKGLAAEAHS